ncbi:MAG: rhamnulokinase [Oscillospiraceae bacterium]|nr:rhamnulokinase [Oscillospiraceae bacterium]
MKKRVLAFDFGASGGRAVLGIFDGRQLKLQEVHRFPNEPVAVGGHLYWDVLRLLHEIKIGLKKAHEMGGFDSVGIDTWGVDYGLLDKRGDLLANPLHYRDKRTDGMIHEAEQRISLEELYALTGNQIMQINTAFQLLEHQKNAPELLEAAQCFLLMPDLLAYFLTGDISAERSIAGTTQLFDASTGGWSAKAVEALGLPEHIFPPVMQTGTIKGMLCEEICEELGIPSVPVYAVCGHDTQCAAAAVPSADNVPFTFISCGTWALFGTELHETIVNEQSVACNLTNEVGYGDTVTFLKNITGLWLIQETRRTLAAQGKQYTYAELERMAADAPSGLRFIDTDAPAFGVSGDMPKRVRDWCTESSQPLPADVSDVLRCIYESLACKFRDALEEIHSCTGQRYCYIYMLGGGVKDALLCQLTADVCGIPVLTGPVEATAYGNAAIQLISAGVLEDLNAARKLIAASVKIREYTPNPENAYIYDNYKKIFN